MCHLDTAASAVPPTDKKVQPNCNPMAASAKTIPWTNLCALHASSSDIPDGLSQVVEGMTSGSVRLAVLPASLGYGVSPVLRIGR